jgi:hypothetical protein
MARPVLISVIALVGFLAACGTQEERSAAASKPAASAPNSLPVAPSQGPTAAPTPEPTCFVKTDANPTWRPAATGNREAKCFEQDACNGGIGSRPSLCAKWAIGPDAPSLAWSAALTNPRPQNDIPPPPDRISEDTQCVNGGCAPHGLVNPTPIRQSSNGKAPIVSTIPARECVKPGITRFIPNPPLRGVILDAYGPFAAGDVIYVPGYEDDDGDRIWWRGAWHRGILDALNVVVRWDPIVDDSKGGRWVEYTRDNGERGWARDPEVGEAACIIAQRAAP